MKLSRIFYLALLAMLFLLPAAVAAQTKLLRFPDIYGDKVVFTYGGDLWTAPVTGGTATRLTTHPGIEVFAKFSPDGKWLAFTGQYDGDEQVYVMPATGGEPKQLTFYPAKGPLSPRWGYDNQVYGWTKDGKNILFRSQRDSWTLPISKLYTVSIEGGAAEALPMPESGAGDYSPDGTKMVYSPRMRDFRSEKRYGGGQANVLYTFDLKTYDTKRISEGPRPSRDPMWIGNTIYYNSDKDGHFNLYAYDVASGKSTQLTTNKVWDVRWPSSDNDSRIVYELDGELQIFDVKTKKNTALAITVPDDGLNRRPSRINVANYIEDVELSPKGERALFCARGDIFTAPIEKGATRNLTHSSGAHDKWPRWSPDGSRIAFISDKSGEEEVYVIAQDGATAAEQLTNGGKAMRYAPEWSADGKQLAFGDKDGKLFILTLADKKLTEIADSPSGQIRDYAWSPRGNFLSFSMPNPNGYASVYIWSASANKLHKITDELFNAYSPAWDAQGNYIYYLSDREFAPQISGLEFNFATNRATGIFAASLRKDVKHPFPPESDEVTITKEGDAPKPPAANGQPRNNQSGNNQPGNNTPPAAPAKPAELTIDFDGLNQRVVRVPVEANNYNNLSANNGHLIYTVNSAFYYGRGGDRPPSLRIYSLKDRRETTLVDGAFGYALSADGTKLLAIQGPTNLTLFDANPQGERSKKPVSTAGLYVDRVPTEEWNQIFNEVWRRYRDWFYVPNMHGYDWEALREQYRPLLKYVAHRSDLNYVISEMIAELTVQHAYIDGGDFNIPPRPRVALPGARFELDKESGRYKITKIFAGQNEEELYRSPLTEVGINIAAGDYVLAINGEELKGNDDPYRLLRNRADNPVTLTVNSKPSMEGARTVSYRPITDESNLIYLDWVTTNRKKVEQLSGGKLGYIHIPDMGASGIREFIKWYYGQMDKDGMVVDVRANGGGNVSRMLIERMRRKLLALGYSRTNDRATTYPDQVFTGPMAAILNENSASDGDIFPAMFREARLGLLIGKRSWGGVVGITNRGTLIDGGGVNVPEFGFANPKGEWIIEGYGVDPDIEVENDPKSVIAGRDPQLERAVEEVMKQLPTKGYKLPPRPPAPVKTPKN
ncbi:MAG: PD40 domain-containing protein [Acidobacteria bacterium]|nr:PD40 domain-containing protein [Acidobacteriota bacterium]